MATGIVRAALLSLGILGTGGIARSEEPASAGLPAALEPAPAMLLVSVSINGQPQPDTYLVARRGDAFFVRIEDLAAWRLRPPSVDPVPLDGERFVPLAAIGGPPSAIAQAHRTAGRFSRQPSIGHAILATTDRQCLCRLLQL
jgi:outer membrane usher protein